MVQNGNAFPNVGFEQLPWLAALVSLVEGVPPELVRLQPKQYAALIASVACVRAMADVFQSSRAPTSLALSLRGFDENPVYLIRAAMTACPDEAPSPQTVELAFIGDLP